ncbi:hypothetical protein L596_001120 [Steinernema carpocapsae]|uniref:Uncharacterized protein n=1 Tax=Steinernema carpocapsae TaxID=34508 RepID=A0A4U8UK13_STECR|nr:hypothetical protein L596_001120 [Steinernema carpocapsae]
MHILVKIRSTIQLQRFQKPKSFKRFPPHLHPPIHFRVPSCPRPPSTTHKRCRRACGLKLFPKTVTCLTCLSESFGCTSTIQGTSHRQPSDGISKLSNGRGSDPSRFE